MIKTKVSNGDELVESLIEVIRDNQNLLRCLHSFKYERKEELKMLSKMMGKNSAWLHTSKKFGY